MVELPENSEELPDNSKELPDNSLQMTENADKSDSQVEKKRRGRPKGSMDKAPRKRTVIREEPVTPPAEPEPIELAEPEPVTKAEPKPKAKARRTVIEPVEPVAMKRQPAPVVIPPAPLSPRTLFRQAGATIYALQSQRETARRDFWAQQVEKSLR